ncbi:MAG: UbiX family flavin prenyltransferase [Prevotellaceae bacterium]|jgi:4-hydroxy-3-polyprenylbenzoate decarboxylase|nr:UbiX family flavin prenyltransferase [Prevotellaceae bacterium]
MTKMSKRKIIIGITGASGQIYAKILLDLLNIYHSDFDEVNVIFTKTGKQVFDYEIGENIAKYKHIKIHENDDLFAPFSSGSSDYDTLIVIPCSMGMLARIANGYANDLIARTADVMLKERRKLIVVARETPLNLIHIRNMEQITLAGGIICPASPSFYGKPKSVYDVAKTVVERVLSLSDINIERYKWSKN